MGWGGQKYQGNYHQKKPIGKRKNRPKPEVSQRFSFLTFFSVFFYVLFFVGSKPFGCPLGFKDFGGVHRALQPFIFEKNGNAMFF